MICFLWINQFQNNGPEHVSSNVLQLICNNQFVLPEEFINRIVTKIPDLKVMSTCARNITEKKAFICPCLYADIVLAISLLYWKNISLMKGRVNKSITVICLFYVFTITGNHLYQSQRILDDKMFFCICREYMSSTTSVYTCSTSCKFY